MEMNMNRRGFLAAGTAATVMTAAPTILAQGAGKKLNVALIGCGGRGTGAAANALNGNPNTQIVAVADLFADRIQSSLKGLQGYRERIAVSPDRIFQGIDAYKRIMELDDVDVVILTTPPHFRPTHIEAAVAAKKHIFAEKPLAVDPAGLQRVKKAVAQAKAQNTAFLTGFCYRFHVPKQDLMPKILEDKIIGDVVSYTGHYNTHALWTKPRKQDMGDTEFQLRNWLYYCWMSGDHIVEQGIHNVDKLNWVMGDKPPIAVNTLGGRQTRTEQPKFGHIFDHFSCNFEFEGINGGPVRRGTVTCRQQAGTTANVTDHIYGTKGYAELQSGKAWNSSNELIHRHKRKGRERNMYDQEHYELYQSILGGGATLNTGESAVISTGMGIMARISGYTGKRYTWKDLMNSTEDLTPPTYNLKAPLEVAPVALPGTGNWEAYTKSLLKK